MAGTGTLSFSEIEYQTFLCLKPCLPSKFYLTNFICQRYFACVDDTFVPNAFEQKLQSWQKVNETPIKINKTDKIPSPCTMLDMQYIFNLILQYSFNLILQYSFNPATLARK
jgi:hypothetical protein